MAGVFVSYAREDAAKAKAIAVEIERAGFDVWIDQRIGSGSEYSREIEQALASASAVVVVWSKNSIDSPWVRDEAAEGRDAGKLVPVVIDDSRPPIGFRQFQSTDLVGWSARGKPRQIEPVIAAIQAKTGAPPRPQQPLRADRGPLRPPVILASAGLVAIVLALAAYIYIGRGKQAELAPSIAILPFTADASDADGRKLASATHDALAETLSQGAYSISALDSAPAPGVVPADFLVKGRASTAADKALVTVRLEDTARHIVLFTHQWEDGRAKAAELSERVSAQVASQISWTAPLIAVEKRHPSDPAIAAALLGGGSAGLEAVGDLSDYDRARRLAAKAPDSPLAQNTLAFNAAFSLGQLPHDQRAEAVALGRRAYDRALALAPESGGNYIPWCGLHSEQRTVQCEDHLRKGMRADPDAAFVNFFLALLLVDVGRDKEATELARVSLAHDPYMPHKLGIMMRMLEITGRTKESADLYQRAVRWWPGSEALVWRRFSGMVVRGDFRAAQAFNKEIDHDRPSPILAAVNSGSVSAIRAACATPGEGDAPICMLALARFGDLDSAFVLADRLYPNRRGRTPAEEERIWLDQPDLNARFFLTGPGAAPLRRDPRYLVLAERVGLLEYWRSGRLPDFCQPPKPEPVCAQIRVH